MEIKNQVIYLCLFMFSCAGNFFPNDEETGKAAKRRCAEATFQYFYTIDRGENCDICLVSMSIDCKTKKSGQLIKF